MMDDETAFLTDRDLGSFVCTSYAAGVRRSVSLLPHYNGLDAVREALGARGVTDVMLKDDMPHCDHAYAIRDGRPIAYLNWTLVRADRYRDPFFPD